MKKRSFKGQLLFGNIIISTVALLVFGLIVLLYNYSLIKANLHAHDEHVVALVEERVEHLINNPIKLLVSVNEQLKLNPKAFEESSIANYLETILDMYDNFDQIRIVNDQGDVELALPNKAEHIITSVADESFYKQNVAAEMTWSSIYISPITNKPTITLSTRLSTGLIMADLSLEKMVDVLKSDIVLEYQNISIVDEYGNYLANDDFNLVNQQHRYKGFNEIKTLIHEPNRMIKIDSKPGLLITAQVLNTLSQNQWYLICEIDKSKAYTPLRTLAFTVSLTLLVIVFMTIIFVVMSFKGVNKALKLAAEKTALIAKGNYQFENGDTNFVEFDELSEHFYQMVDCVKQRESEINVLNENLEKKVEERTLQLKETNDQLIQTNAMLEALNAHTEELNAQLKEEVKEKIQREIEINELNQTLEIRIQERTLDLLERGNNLERAVQIAKEANHSKSQFLADMSHEIRTPLNGILGMIDVMLMTRLSKEQKGYLDTIRSSSSSLLTILNDVLDYSKIEAGKMRLKYKPFALDTLLHDVYNLFTATATHKGLNLEIILPEDVPSFVIGDENRVRQVLSNFVSNAIKFTDEGSIQISVKVNQVLSDAIDLNFSVKDSGKGISSLDMMTLFNRFTQLDPSHITKMKGTGLGLAISKMLVDLMEGTIGATSQLNQGSEFYFNLTLGIDPSDRSERIKEVSMKRERLSDLSNLKLLVVEDDPTSLYMMKVILNKLKANIMDAVNGEQALSILEQETFDLILMDVNMPIMDGLTASRIIRKREWLNRRGQPIGIIAMTAYAMSGDKEKCLEAGMTDYLSKPIELDALVGIIQKYSEERLSTDNLSDSQPVPQVKNEIVSKTIQELMDASGLDEETCLFILKTYVHQTKELLQRIKESFKSANSMEIGNFLHKLKGSSGNVRATTVMNHAVEAEHAFKHNDLEQVELLVNEIASLMKYYEEVLN